MGIEKYKIEKQDVLRIEVALGLLIREAEKENEKLLKKIEENKKAVARYQETRLKLTGVFHCDEEPLIYDEKLKGVFEDIK